MKLQDGYLLNEIAGEYVLFPVGQNIVDYKHIMSVNGSGKFIIEKLQQDISYGELLLGMIEEYEATPEESQILKNDLDEFLNALRAQSMLVE